MRKTAILIAALAGLSAGSQAHAEESAGYMGVGFSAIWSNGGSVYSDTVNENVTSGGKIYGGYQWGPMGMEISYNHLGTYDSLFAGALVSQMKTSAIALAGIYTAPIAPGFNLSAKVGLAFTEAKHSCVSLCGTGTPSNVDTKELGLSGLIGLGVGMRMSNDLEVRVDFDHFGSVHHKVDLTKFTTGYDIMSVSLKITF